MRSIAVVVIAGTLSLLVAGESRAQEGTGFWAVGLSFGSHEIEGRGAEGGLGGRVGYVGFAGAADGLLSFGVDARVWGEIGGPTSVVQSVLGPTVHVYPLRSAGLVLELGLGLAYLTESSGGGRENEFGIGVSAGLGYDIPVGTDYRIRPFIDLGAAAAGRSTTLAEFGAAFLWN